MKRVILRRDGTRVELPLIEQAVSLTKAVTREIMSDTIPLSDETVTNRIAICKACDDISKDLKTCTQCGCMLEHKTRFRTASCPLGKW
jgi:hypothetical protein